MAPLTARRSRALTRAAAVSFATALAVLTFAGPALLLAEVTPGVAYADPGKPKPTKSGHPTTPADPTESADATKPPRPTKPAAPNESATSPAPSSSADSGSPPNDALAPDRTERVKSPGTITCEDLGLGTTLQKINGARNNKVLVNDSVSSVVKDTDVDRDGDPDSLFVTVTEGAATAVVALHGNRANIYTGSFGVGEHGPFYSPSQPKNVHPPVTHRLVCGALAAPSKSPEASRTAPKPAGSDGPSGLPVTGLALTGLVVGGLGMVGAGVAMRALRRKSSPSDPTDT